MLKHNLGYLAQEYHLLGPHGTLSNLFTAQRYNLVKSGYINATHARDPISLSMPSAEMFSSELRSFQSTRSQIAGFSS
jgi:hypothetical protein